MPQDVFQIAKVSKILQIMEKGNAAQFKNKSLDEIDIDMNEVENEDEDRQLSTVSSGRKKIIIINFIKTPHATIKTIHLKIKFQNGN